MALHINKKDTNFDLRVVDRYLQKKVISESELKERLSSLPDLSNQCEFIPIPTGKSVTVEEKP